MTTAPAAPSSPVAFVVCRRANSNSQWSKAGRADTHAAAVALICGPGDWWIAALSDARLATTAAAK